MPNSARAKSEIRHRCDCQRRIWRLFVSDYLSDYPIICFWDIASCGKCRDRYEHFAVWATVSTVCTFQFFLPVNSADRPAYICGRTVAYRFFVDSTSHSVCIQINQLPDKEALSNQDAALLCCKADQTFLHHCRSA